jgi:capsular polysaccharide export protein
LLLQGPLGPFFQRLARDLEWAGAKVCKVNFNGGDWLFYRRGIPFRGQMEEWPAFFEKLLTEREIDVVLLFGDCRPMHSIAYEIASRRGVDIGVFEEGYIRPDYITFEQYGVNFNSTLSQIPEEYQFAPSVPAVESERVGNTIWYAALWAILYYLAGTLLWPIFPHYRHHRPLHLLEGLIWVRSVWRKWYYVLKERGLEQMLVQPPLSLNFFLVPLQVHNDAQISIHSEFVSVEDFIRETICSFAAQAPEGTFLVIKHHPMDRGYHDYKRFIRQCSRQNNVDKRVFYLHDQHLPTLLLHARGVIVINSTVGFSALYHNTPVKVCGRALFDLPGLTFHGSLDSFWTKATECKIDQDFYNRFRAYLIEHSQLNGSFYKRLNVPGSSAGLHWVVQEKKHF